MGQLFLDAPDSHFDDRDVREVLAMLGRLAGASESLTVRRRRLLGDLAALVGADTWVWALQHLDPERLDAGYYTLLEGGSADETQNLAFMQGAFSPQIRDLIAPIAARLDRHVTWSRSQVMDDAAWYASDFYREFRAPSGFDDLLFSFFPVGPQLQSAIRLHRLAGRPAFGVRERDLVHAVSGALDALHRAMLPEERLPSLGVLSRREREVLALLLRGDSRKQIAEKLKLSQHTIGDYMKEIHRALAVHSRGELLARFVPKSFDALTAEG